MSSTIDTEGYSPDGKKGKIFRENRRASQRTNAAQRVRTNYAYNTHLDGKHRSSAELHTSSKIKRGNTALWTLIEPGQQEVDERTEHDYLLDYLVHINQEAPYKDVKEMIFEEGFGGSAGYDKQYWECRNQEEEREIEMKKGQTAVRVLRTPDNTVFNHVNGRIRQFFELGGYRAFPEVVTVSVDIREIMMVDTKDGRYRVSFIATTRWYDAFFDNHDYFDQTQFYTTTRPYITFDHVDEGDDPQGIPQDAAQLSPAEKHSGTVYRKPNDPPGVLYHSQRCQATFRVENELENFPFDVQKLSMNIRLWGSSVRGDADCGRILLPVEINMSLAHRHLEWTAYQAISFLAPKRRFDRQDLQIDLTLKRRAAFFEKNVYVILCSMPTMSFFAYTIPGDGTGEGDGYIGGFEGRCQITLTLMLTSVAYKFFLAGMLPNAPYLTILDKYIYFCYTIICLIFFANSLTLVVEYLQAGDEFQSILTSQDVTSLAVRFDNISFLVLITVWVLGNAYIFLWMNRNAMLKMRSLLVGRVASDMEKASMKRAEKIAADTQKVPAYSEREKTVKAAIDGRMKKKKALKQSIVRYNDPQSTLRKRRADVVRFYKGLEKADQTVKPNKLPKTGQCHCSACDGRRMYKEPSKDIITLCLAAGIERWRAGAMSKQFESHGITHELLRSIYDAKAGTVVIQELLDKLEIDLADSVKIMAALGGGNKLKIDGYPAQVLALQGSSSYLMKYLGLTGQLVPMSEFKSRLVAELTKFKSGTGDLDMTNTANVIFAHTILQSTLTDAEYVYSQRTFKWKGPNPDGKFVVASQVWSGYLVSRKDDWYSGGAIGVDIGTGKMAFGYADMGREGADTELPSIKSIDLSEKESSPDKFFEELARAMECMDTRNLLPYSKPKKPINPEETDTDRLAEICEPLLVALVDVLKHLESQDVKITGREPIFFFGTMKMRDWLTRMEAKHGGRCFEMLKGASVFMEMKMPEMRKGSKHKIYFDICPQIDEAKSEHLAFKLALKWGHLEEKDAKKKAFVEKALEGGHVGNLAWGNGSMQGFPDASTYVNAEIGLNGVKAFLEEQVDRFGTVKKEKNGKVDKFAFSSMEAAKKAVDACLYKTRRRLLELAPRLPMAVGRVAEAKAKLAGGGAAEAKVSADDEEYGFGFGH